MRSASTWAPGAMRRAVVRAQVGGLLLAIDARAQRQVHTVRDGDRPQAEGAHACVVERGVRRVLSDREGEIRREHGGRERVDGVLGVLLREEHDAGLPLERDRVGELRRRLRGRGQAELLRELAVVFGVVPRDERVGRVVQIGVVVGRPLDTNPVVDEKATRRPFTADEQRRRRGCRGCCGLRSRGSRGRGSSAARPGRSGRSRRRGRVRPRRSRRVSQLAVGIQSNWARPKVALRESSA